MQLYMTPPERGCRVVVFVVQQLLSAEVKPSSTKASIYNANIVLTLANEVYNSTQDTSKI